MNINKSSWHFKLLNKMGFRVARQLKYEDSNVTLCQYFWNVVGAILMGLCIGWISTFLVLGSLFIAFSIVTGLVIFFGASWLPIVEHGSFMFGSHAGGLIFSFLVGTAFVWQTALEQVKAGLIIPDWMKFSKQKVTPKKETKPNILFEYVKAKKNKFCPIVKLED